jgi:enoyl-CoA hydratase/carnithine racemase
MSEILTEHSGSILRITLNRPAKKNAMTSSMYTTMAKILNDVVNEDDVLVVLWDGAGDSFSAGNDVEDFLQHPPGGEGRRSGKAKPSRGSCHCERWSHCWQGLSPL